MGEATMMRFRDRVGGCLDLVDCRLNVLMSFMMDDSGDLSFFVTLLLYEDKIVLGVGLVGYIIGC